MSTTSLVQVRMDSELKREADKMFKSMGLTMSTAFNLLCRQTIIQKGLPFSIVADADRVAERETAYIVNNCPGIEEEAKQALKVDNPDFVDEALVIR